jgi:hypothetical protein
MSGRVTRPPQGQPEPPDDNGGPLASRSRVSILRLACWAACGLVVVVSFAAALAGSVQGGTLGAACWSAGAFFLAFAADRALGELEGPSDE